jgi:AcrR family transcriptional regulator
MKSPAREKIRDAAIGLFAKKGFAATTTREICQRAGATKPVLYYHFASKERLFTELVLEAWKECHQELLLAAKRGQTAHEKLVHVLAADFELTRRDPRLASMLFRMVFAPQQETPSIDYVQIGRDWAGLIAAIVREGIRRGEMRGRPKDVGEAILGVHMIYTLSFLLTSQPKLDRKLARRIVDLMVKGCGANRTDR